MGISPTIATIGIAVLVALSFGGGFAINEWRNSGKRGQLESVNPALIAANDRCAIDITGVQKAVGVITKGVEEREMAAWKARKSAQLIEAKHSTKATEIKALSQIAPDQQCAAIIQKQQDYVQARGH